MTLRNLERSEGDPLSHAGASPAAKVATSVAKRIFDATGAAAALLFFGPLMLLVAASIVLEDGGPVMFRQRRTGLGGRPFVVLKFRSMRVAEDGPEVRQANRNDERVTRVGRVIRSLSVDELPQLINVLRGHMSLIGPRPHPLALDHAWGAAVPHYGARYRARPGLSGYAQVRGYRGLVRTPDDIVNRVVADNYYIDHWSLWMDVKIVARTIWIVARDPKAF
jgi:putative colanic acid biosynthesis UDP-glucose lipid carrier transferase